MRHLLLSLACLVAAPFACEAETLVGRVVAITDGDTLVLLMAHRRYEIRIAGIDAPERVQPFGPSSQANLGRLAFQKRALAECSRQAGKAPPRCEVWVEGQDVGLHQLQDGMAWWLREDAGKQTPEAAASYQQAEMMAKLGRRGLWSQANPKPPGDWRGLTR